MYFWCLQFFPKWKQVDLKKMPNCKVEKILKGKLDSILSPSPSVKVQIMGGKVCLRGKGKLLPGIVNKLLYSNVCWQHPAIFCLYTCPAHTCPAHTLNFHRRWRWWDRIHAIFLYIFYFTEISFPNAAVHYPRSHARTHVDFKQSLGLSS